MRPQLVRPQQAALLLGSGEVVADFIAAGWLQPVLSEHRLVIYSLREIEKCVARLEAGESPRPDDKFKRPKPPGHFEQPAAPPPVSNSFADQLRGIMTPPPLLLRPEQAATFFGSVELLDEMRKCDWIRPVYCQPRLTLFSVRHLESCVVRLEGGVKPGEYADEKPVLQRQPVAIIEAPAPAIKPGIRLPRKTRRSMPTAAELVAN